MPIEKMQSQTTTYHVCGGDNSAQLTFTGFRSRSPLSWDRAVFRYVTGDQGRTVGADAVGCRPTLPCGLGWPALS